MLSTNAWKHSQFFSKVNYPLCRSCGLSALLYIFSIADLFIGHFSIYCCCSKVETMLWKANQLLCCTMASLIKQLTKGPEVFCGLQLSYSTLEISCYNSLSRTKSSRSSTYSNSKPEVGFNPSPPNTKKRCNPWKEVTSCYSRSNSDISKTY